MPPGAEVTKLKQQFYRNNESTAGKAAIRCFACGAFCAFTRTKIEEIPFRTVNSAKNIARTSKNGGQCRQTQRAVDDYDLEVVT